MHPSRMLMQSYIISTVLENSDICRREYSQIHTLEYTVYSTHNKVGNNIPTVELG